MYTLLLYSQALVKTIPCTLDTTLLVLELAKTNLRSGLTQFILISPDGNILSERQIFIQNKDNFDISVEEINNTASDQSIKTIGLNFGNIDTSSFLGRFSIAIVDDRRSHSKGTESPNILSYLLLNSDLKGFIENPNYYFDNVTLKVRQDLDLVMLTHGYRKWIWKSILNTPIQAFQFTPEVGLTVAGNIKTLFGQPLVNANVTLLTASLQIVSSQLSNQNGNFEFQNLKFSDSTTFILHAVNNKEKNNVKITYNISNNPPITEDDVANQFIVSKTATDIDSSGNNNLSSAVIPGKVLKEVVVKASKITKVADQVIESNKLDYNGPLVYKLMILLHGVRFPYVNDANIYIPASKNATTAAMKIVVNDQEMPRDFDLNTIDSRQVESVAAFTNASYGNGILVLKVKPGVRDVKDMPSIGILAIKANGVYQAREFYIPKVLLT